MKTSLLAGAVVMTLSTASFAARPVVYPLRSQSAATQGIDNAYCYWQARQQSGVDMARESQRPVRTKTQRAAADAGRGASAPPLPDSHGASDGMSQAANGGLSTVEVGSASPTSMESIAARPARTAQLPTATNGSIQTAPSNPGGRRAASAAVAGLPPLPPPEPPMTLYWQAYGDCMQSRGYGVQ